MFVSSLLAVAGTSTEKILLHVQADLLQKQASFFMMLRVCILAVLWGIGGWPPASTVVYLSDLLQNSHAAFLGSNTDSCDERDS